ISHGSRPEPVCALRFARLKGDESSFILRGGNAFVMDGVLDRLGDPRVSDNLGYRPPGCMPGRPEESFRRAVQVYDVSRCIGHDDGIVETLQGRVRHSLGAMEALRLDSTSFAKFFRHLVESCCERADLIRALDFDSLVQVARSDLLGLAAQA